MMDKRYDFIVVGGGICGCVLASRLAESLAKPAVLLIEAGSRINVDDFNNPWQKFTNFMSPDIDHGYTQVLKNCGLPAMPYARGKGLGGSSLSNFLVYTYGSSADYNHWAEQTEDDSWKWENTKERFKKIETVHDETPQKFKKYAFLALEDHGHSGPLHISLPSAWEDGTEMLLSAASAYGHKINLDLNSGNPIGWGLAQMSSHRGVRSTSQQFLSTRVSNLEIWTDTKVAHVLFEGKTAQGVELDNGAKVYASRSTIITAGALDSPKLLMLSGIGPINELQKHNIKVIHELPGVGKNLQDHMIIRLGIKVSEPLSILGDVLAKPDKFKNAMELWEKDKSGPLREVLQTAVLAYLKLPSVYVSDEFKQLDTQTKRYLELSNVPTCEYGMIFGPMVPMPVEPQPSPEHILGFSALPMSTLSQGEVTLSSSDPASPPKFSFNEYGHPFDRRVAIEAVRSIMDFVDSPQFSIFRGFEDAPVSKSDEDIWTYIKRVTIPSWHASGSLKMGKETDPTACLDKNFFVRGVERLQVADMSICPNLTNNHTQATAYLIGQSAAEKIITAHKLDRVVVSARTT